MATLPMQFSFSAGPARAARRVEDEDPFRIVVLADLGSSAPARASLPLARRKPLRVDIDSFETVFERLAPQLDIMLDGAPLSLTFQSLDDFHPDRLFARAAPFVALRKLRAELADPAQFHRAAAALGATPATAATPTGPAAVADASDTERLLGRKPASRTAATGNEPGLTIEGWLHSIVAPHVVTDIASQQKQLMAEVDASIASQMRRLLHDPAFQALEANWRGVERLVQELDLDETLQLLLLDVSRDELAHDIRDHAADLAQSALHRQLCGPQTEAPDGQRWSLLVSDLAIGADIGELQLLAALGALAGRAGTPLLAAARPSLLGSASVGQLADPKTWKPLAGDAAAYWAALRQSAVAPWIGLALPHVLARQPYGKESDPVTAFKFEELATPEHEGYLWGSAAFSLALLAGQAFMEAGWSMELAAGLDIDDLPSHSVRDAGESRQQPCAEAMISESAGETILRQGPMAVLSYRNRNAARLLRWQSIAAPSQALRGAWA